MPFEWNCECRQYSGGDKLFYFHSSSVIYCNNRVRDSVKTQGNTMADIRSYTREKAKREQPKETKQRRFKLIKSESEEILLEKLKNIVSLRYTDCCCLHLYAVQLSPFL